MENRYRAIVFNSVSDFINELPQAERAKIFGSINKIKGGDWSSLHIKTLKGPLRELVVKQYRLIFFMSEDVLYFVRAFQKKTAKTPPQEVEQAERIYKLVTL
jgi:phage-related protein